MLRFVQTESDPPTYAARIDGRDVGEVRARRGALVVRVPGRGGRVVHDARLRAELPTPDELDRGLAAAAAAVYATGVADPEAGYSVELMPVAASRRGRGASVSRRRRRAESALLS